MKKMKYFALLASILVACNDVTNDNNIKAGIEETEIIKNLIYHESHACNSPKITNINEPIWGDSLQNKLFDFVVNFREIFNIKDTINYRKRLGQRVDYSDVGKTLFPGPNEHNNICLLNVSPIIFNSKKDHAALLCLIEDRMILSLFKKTQSEKFRWEMIGFRKWYIKNGELLEQ